MKKVETHADVFQAAGYALHQYSEAFRVYDVFHETSTDYYAKYLIVKEIRLDLEELAKKTNDAPGKPKVDFASEYQEGLNGKEIVRSARQAVAEIEGDLANRAGYQLLNEKLKKEKEQ